MLKFIQRFGGLKAIVNLTESLNSGLPHKTIAEDLGMDPGQLSRFITDNYDLVYVLKPHVAKLIDFFEEDAVARYEEQKKRSANVLKYHGTNSTKGTAETR